MPVYSNELVVNVDATDVVRKLVMLDERAKGIDMGVFGAALATAADDKIDAEGAVGSYPRWKELSPSTKAKRPGARMLRGRSGLLAQFQVIPEGGQSVVVRSPAPYAGFHVTGYLIPKRDFFELDFDTVLEQVGSRVLEQVDR